VLISTAIKQHLSHCQHIKNLSDHTLRAYTIDLNEFQRFVGVKKHLQSCHRECLRNYVQYLFEERKLKETSVKRRIACLKSMFSWFESDEVIEKSPFRIMNLKIRLPRQLPKALSKKELKALLTISLKYFGFRNRNIYQNDEFRRKIVTQQDFIQLTTQLAIELLFATGIRVGELVSIKIEDIAAEDRTIKIKGKGNRERVVFLPDQYLVALINIYQQVRNNFNPNTKILLINSRGAELNTQLVRLLIRKAGKRAKLARRITPHMLRHSAATHLLDSGVDIRHVQKLLGHQSITTTQIYTHVSDAQLKSVICKSHPMEKFMEK